MRAIAVLLLCFFVLPALGCGTVHPRWVPGLEQTAAHLRKVAILEPDFHVGVKYYRTDVYIYSRSESDRISLLFSGNVGKVLMEKGYEVSYVPACSKKEFANNAACDPADRVTWEGPSILRMPGGMARGSKHYPNEGYARLLQRADQIFVQVISMDPAYDSPNIPERLFFLAPKSELTDYDLVVISYGVMREETRPENRSRWIRNLSINAAMLPMTLGSFIFPFALPITLNMPHFIDASPDLSWIVLMAFDPEDGKILYINDFSYKKGKTLNAVRRAAKILLEKFPERAP